VAEPLCYADPNSSAREFLAQLVDDGSPFFIVLSPAAMQSAIRLLERPGSTPARGDIVETAAAEVENANG
jgi:hypothetical protein